MQDFVERNSQYYMSNEQYTIHPPYTVLSAEGKKALEEVKKQEFKGTIQNARFVKESSGMWIRPEYPCPRTEDPEEARTRAVICTKNNLRIYGTLDGKPICTNILVFYDRENSWAYTLSKSLYKLENVQDGFYAD